MSPSKISVLILLGLAILIGQASFYTIMQHQNGLVLRLGRIKTDSKGQAIVVAPGLHMKIPLVDSIAVLDTRLQTDAAKSSRIYIEKENYFVVDYYIKWSIKDLSLYYTSTGGDPRRAETLMEQKIDNELRNQFGTRALKNVVAQGRDNIMSLLKTQAEESVSNLGIQVTDVRLKAIDLPPTVRQFVFNSMRADRMKVANGYRYEGERQAISIRAAVDGKRITLIARAKLKANEILANGVTEAAKIYATAYAKDSRFFAFYRSMEAYKAALAQKQTILVMRPTGEFFKYFNGGDSLKASTLSKNQ